MEMQRLTFVTEKRPNGNRINGNIATCILLDDPRALSLKYTCVLHAASMQVSSSGPIAIWELESPCKVTTESDQASGGHEAMDVWYAAC